MSLNHAFAYRVLWLKGMGLVLAHRCLLHFDPAGTIRRAVLRSSQGREPSGPEDWKQIILTGHATATAGSWVVDPLKPCLPIALATQILLARQGYRAILRIGVHRSEGAIEGHAWVECAGRCIVGKPAPSVVALQSPSVSDG